MKTIENKSFKTNSYNNSSSEDTQALVALHKEIQRKGGPAANDVFYGELEMRYGGGFAQWVADRMRDAVQEDKAK